MENIYKTKMKGGEILQKIVDLSLEVGKESSISELKKTGVFIVHNFQ